MLKKRTKKRYPWILCNKWFIPMPKPMVLTEEEKHGDKAPNKKLEFDYIPKWTPVGIAAGIPKCWDSEKEVVEVMSALVNDRPKLQKFMFVACQVKYVPGNVKARNKYWFDKYVIKEKELKIQKRKDTGEAVFTDESKININ